MLMIVINKNRMLELNEPVDKKTKITSLSVVNTGGPKLVPEGLDKVFADWLYDIVQRTEGIIIYNGVIVEKASIEPYKGS